MKKIISLILSIVICLLNTKDIGAVEFNLNARAAILIDADNNRVLYGENENTPMAIASTTKIMTLIIALEYGALENEVTISSYAASQPDVQLNIVKGEKYRFEDLLYIMMLKSYNDVAVSVAEYVGGILNGDTSPNESNEESLEDIKRFAQAMNEKAIEIGCKNSYFITPNGLDAKDDSGFHSSTAYDLALIGSYAIKNEKITEICTTKSYDYKELNGKRSGTVYNADRFLDMIPGAVGLKTGFTGDAGYCFVGAVKQDGRSYVSVVLGSGWPPNKNYKWSDTKILMNYGLEQYFPEKIHGYEAVYKEINIKNGIKNRIMTYIPFDITCLISDSDTVNVIYELNEIEIAPVRKNQEVGRVYIYINDKLMYRLPILTLDECEEKNFFWYLKYLL